MTQSCQLSQFLTTQRNILLYLLIYGLVSPCTSHESMMLRTCWTFGTTFNSAVDSAIYGERVFAPEYGPKEDVLIEWAVIEAMKQCSKFVECVYQIGWQSQTYHKSSAQLCHQEMVEQLQHFKRLFHTVVQRGLF